jgi:hypothetical protein
MSDRNAVVRLAARTTDPDDTARLNAIADAVAQSLWQHTVKSWHQNFCILGEILELAAEIGRRTDRTDIKAERERILIDAVEEMFRKLPPTPTEMWELSGRTDTEALIDMLAPFAATLPPTLLDGLNERLQQQQTAPDFHLLRYALVREGVEVKGLTWAKAFVYASERLAGTSAAGGKWAMRESYRLRKRLARRLASSLAMSRLG